MNTWLKRILTILIASVSVFTVLYLEVRSEFEPEQQTDTSATSTEPEAAGEEIDWDYWKSMNPDIVAWVRIADTRIDYPVVQASEEDPEYYLSHDVYGEENENGCPYIDADCTSGLDSANVIILGHHMNDGSMFADLASYHDAEFAEGHPFITVFAPEGDHTLAVTSSRTIPGTLEAKRADFVNKTDLTDYKGECYDESSVKLTSRELACAQARFFTFVTCSYFENPADERTLVYAVEI